MTRVSGTRACFFLGALLVFAGTAAAQSVGVDTSQPIIVVQKSKEPKHIKFAGLFVSSTNAAVTIRDTGSYRVQTFSFGPKASAKMEQVVAKGGYRYGDKIEVEYATGTTIALKIHGKPSSKSN